MEKEEHLRKYVQDVCAQTREFAQDLISENSKLRALAASLERENLRLQQDVGALEGQVERQTAEHLRLEKQLRDVEAAKKRALERYAEIERQNASLANLYVASYRLHGTLDRQEVLNIITEIIINLIGSEELGIFELNHNNSALSLISHFGLDPRSFNKIPMGEGLIGRAASTGQTYLCPNDGLNKLPQEAHLTACVPLKLDGRVIGIIAVFNLLQQKNGFDELDRELFDLLATHAATALYCTRVGVST